MFFFFCFYCFIQYFYKSAIPSFHYLSLHILYFIFIHNFTITHTAGNHHNFEIILTREFLSKFIFFSLRLIRTHSVCCTVCSVQFGLNLFLFLLLFGIYFITYFDLFLNALQSRYSVCRIFLFFFCFCCCSIVCSKFSKRLRKKVQKKGNKKTLLEYREV